MAADLDRLCAEAIRATWDHGPHARLALALAVVRDAGHHAELAGDGCSLWVDDRYHMLVPDCSPEDVVTGVRAALATLEDP